MTEIIQIAGEGQVKPCGDQKHVMVALPVYTGTIHTSTMRAIIQDMLAITDAGHKFSMMDDCGNAMIADCRAKMVADFLASDCTDLLFVDWDVAWETGALLSMLNQPVDFVAAIYPQRKDPIQYCVRYIEDRKELWADPETGLLEVDGVPAGCMRLTRSMLEKMVAAYPETEFWCQGVKDDKAWDLFGAYRDKANPSIKFGEDYSFCRRWRDIGGQVWIDPRIRMGHTGFKTFTGSLGEWLKGDRNGG
jgi:hypothetical protein